MSAFVIIECDWQPDGQKRCRAESDHGASTATEGRRWAKRDGWTRDGKDDLCPIHARSALRRADMSTSEPRGGEDAPLGLCSLDPLHGPAVTTMVGNDLCHSCYRSLADWIDAHQPPASANGGST